MASECPRFSRSSRIATLGAAVLAGLLGGCAPELLDQEPDVHEMRAAYLASDEVRLAGALLGDTVTLSEFYKIGCGKTAQAVLRCRFFARFGAAPGADQSGAVLDSLVGAASGFTREATFFKNENGGWICREVIAFGPDSQQGEPGF